MLGHFYLVHDLSYDHNVDIHIETSSNSMPNLLYQGFP